MRPREETCDQAAADAEIGVERLMARLREPSGPPPEPGGAPDVPAALADPWPDLATLYETSDVQHPALASHRKVVGSALLVVKRLLLRLLTPSLEAQARHNAATTRLLTHFALRLESLERQVEALSSRLADPEDGGAP